MTNAENDTTAPTSDASDDEGDRSRSGNGLRLDASSRNGSSSASGHPGTTALRGGAGSSSLPRGPASPRKSGLAAVDGTVSEEDEGYADAEEGEEGSSSFVENMYSGIGGGNSFDYDHPVWSFEGMGGGGNGGGGSEDGAASDVVDLGSAVGDQEDRLKEDFGGDEDGEEEGEDGVAEIRIGDEKMD